MWHSWAGGGGSIIQLLCFSLQKKFQIPSCAHMLLRELCNFGLLPGPLQVILLPAFSHLFPVGLVWFVVFPLGVGTF